MAATSRSIINLAGAVASLLFDDVTLVVSSITIAAISATGPINFEIRHNGIVVDSGSVLGGQSVVRPVSGMTLQQIISATGATVQILPTGWQIGIGT